MSTEFPQQSGTVGYKNPPTWTRFGAANANPSNPGGRPKDRPQTTVILDRLRAMTVAELEAYEPANAAEAACKLQVLHAATAKPLKALPSFKEITDRTEGKAPQRIEHSGTISVDVTVILSAARAALDQHYPDLNWLEAPDEEVQGWIEVNAPGLLSE